MAAGALAKLVGQLDRGTDGSVVSLEAYGETQVCNLPRTTGGPELHIHTSALTHTMTGCNLPVREGFGGSTGGPVSSCTCHTCRQLEHSSH